MFRDEEQRTPSDLTMDYSHWLFKEVKWVFSAVCAVFIFVILISYSPLDSAWSFVSDRHAIVRNFGGLLGAWVSDFLLYFLGLSAYLLPLSIVRQLMHWPRQWRRHPLWLRVLSFVLLCLSVSVLGSLSSMPSLYPESTGGLLGAVVAAQLVPWMGYTGTVLFFLFVLFCTVTIRLHISWLRVLEAVGRGVIAVVWWVMHTCLPARFWGPFAAPVALPASQNISEEEGDEDVMSSDEDHVTDDPFEDEAFPEDDFLPESPDEAAVFSEEEADDSVDKHDALVTVNNSTLADELANLLNQHQPSTSLLPSVPEMTVTQRGSPTARRKRRYTPPAVRLLNDVHASPSAVSSQDIESNARLIETKLKEFGVTVRVVSALPGPVITRYEIEPDIGVKGAQIVNLVKDLARSLSVLSIRVVETIPGKSCMGLEVPNQHRQMVYFAEVIRSSAYRESHAPLTMILGKDIAGQPLVVDLARMPHLLVAGTTGSGKSVGINTMILSLIYRLNPDQLRMLLIDPKVLELSVYEETPHLLAPVVTDMKKATQALSWCVSEMERRYQLMSAASVRHISGFNDKVDECEGDAAFAAKVLGYPGVLARLPHIVVVIDEFADLMMVVGKKIEELIARLAQKARAAGIHLILATQRPSVDVITGLIKANIPTRIAFQVSSKIDSRTIIDQMGAESLLGQGDMLYLPPGVGYPWRVHGAYVSDEEVQRVTNFLRQNNQVNYAVSLGTDTPAAEMTAEEDEDDPLYGDAVQIVLQSKRPSISLVQRHLRVGYNRAARLLEKMEKEGLVSSMNAAGARDILVSKE